MAVPDPERVCSGYFLESHGLSLLFDCGPQLPARSAPLTVIGPRGIKRKLAQLAAAFGDHLSDTPFELNVIEIEPGEERLLGDVVHLSAGETIILRDGLQLEVELG